MAEKKNNKQVYTVEYFELMDGTEVEVKPLPIKRLRKAQNSINEVIRSASEVVQNDEDADEVEDYDDRLVDVLIGVVHGVLQGQEGCEKFAGEDGRELLEDTLDQDTMYEIIRVSTGFDFLAMRKRAETMMQETLTS